MAQIPLFTIIAESVPGHLNWTEHFENAEGLSRHPRITRHSSTIPSAGRAGELKKLKLEELKILRASRPRAISSRPSLFYVFSSHCLRKKPSLNKDSYKLPYELRGSPNGIFLELGHLHHRQQLLTTPLPCRGASRNRSHHHSLCLASFKPDGNYSPCPNGCTAQIMRLFPLIFTISAADPRGSFLIK